MSTPTTQATYPESKSRFLINRNYRFLFTGRAISLLGDQVSTYTIILWIVTIIASGQAWAPLAISAVLIASLAPNLLIGPLAGVFVDRWDHRVTMMRMDTIRALLSFLLVAFTGVIQLPFFTNGRPPQMVQLVVICTITFLNSACSQFFSPASMGILARIIPKGERPKAAGLGQTMQAFATIVGPPLAAPLLFAFGVQWALLIDAFSFVVSLLTIWAIHVPVAPGKRSVQNNLRREFIDGLRFSFGNHTIRTIIVASFIATFGAGAFDALYVFFLPGNLHVPAAFTGVVAAALGVGMIGGAFAAAKMARQVGLERLLYLSLLGSGLCLIMLSRLTIFLPALALFFLFGTLLASIRVATSPMLLNETPQEMLGRVFAVINPTSILASLISASLSGYLASVFLGKLHWHILGTTFGPIDTIFTGVGLLFLLSGLYTYRSLTRKQHEQEVQVS
ncbi:MAG TPA: MFS transporter [Ktedonobacteraceae bacterium]|nr:MFS transporter [Ktedonobacteraceae bacterium]